MALQQAEIVFQDFLNTRELKLTEQRKLVLDVFLNSRLHLTIEEVYNKSKKRNPNIGLTTVWRTIKLLRECGLVSGFKHTDGTFRYKLGHEYHEHLICVKCGRVIEVMDPNPEVLRNNVFSINNFKVLHWRLELYGICHNCS